jgi:hypothetical protein
VAYEFDLAREELADNPSVIDTGQDGFDFLLESIFFR